MSNNHGIIKFRRGTASEWANSLPQPGGEVLKLGEPGFEKDTYKLKIGDGVTPWNSLPYIAGGIGGNNGPLSYTYETDFFTNGGNQTVLTSDLTSLPSWLSTYEAETGFTQDGSLPGNAFGFDSNGLWFTGDAQPNDQSYPVRTNFNIPSESTTTVIFTVNHNEFCSDHGICFYRDGDAPVWSWGPNSSRIAIQVDCPQPMIGGLLGQIPVNTESGGSQSLGSPGFYTFQITYNPSASFVTLNVHSGQDTSGTLLETLSLNERLPEGDYRIGFVSDQDDGETKSYFSNLSISYGNPISQLTINKVSNGVDFSEFFQQLTDSDQKSSIRISDVNNSNEFIVVDASVPVASGTNFVFDVTQQVNGGLELVSGSQYYINIDIIGSTTADNINPTSSIKVCSLELTGNHYYAGDPVTVYQINSNQENKVYDAIDTNIILTRGTPSYDGGGGLYNSALQEDYSDNGDSGPAGTEWNVDGWDDLSNITSRSYDSLYNVLNGNIGKQITNAELVMHDIINDKYYKFDFSYWQPGGGQNVGPNYPIGGFKYTRTLLWVEQSPVTFTRPPNSPNTVDNIDTGLTIKRGNGGGIYNSESESGWDVSMSPVGTLWNIEGWDNLSNVANREYVPFYAATGGQLGNMVTTRQYVMKDTINNKYYKIGFSNWGGSNGSFEYTRTLINGHCQGNIQFSDGTLQNTAFNETTVTNIANDVVADAFNTTLVAGSGIDLNYDSGSSTLTISSNNTSNLDTLEPDGFVNRSDSSITFDDENRLFSIGPKSPATSYTIYNNGVKVVKSAVESIYLPNSTALYFIHFDKSNNELSYKTTGFNFETDIPIAHVYYNAGEIKSVYFGEERHGIRMDTSTHKYLHNVFGTQYINGLSISNYSISGNGSSNSDATIAIGDGLIYDEDIEANITNSNTPSNPFEQILYPIAQIPVYYKLGTDGFWTNTVANNFPVKTGTTIQYNLLNAGSWSDSNSNNPTNNRYIAYWICATTQEHAPIISIMGQRIDSSLEQATSNNAWGSLNLTGLPIVELRPLYRLIYDTKSSFTNDAKGFLVDILDIRTHMDTVTGLTQNDHGSLYGLADDDHLQYIHIDNARTIDAIHTFTNGLVSSGNISIGTNSPTYELEVIGGGKFSQTYPTVINIGNSSGSINTNISTGQIFDITITGDATLTNPTNPIDGVTVRWRIVQDGTGGHTVTLDTKFNIPSSATTPLAWSTAPNAMDILAATYHAGRDKWDIVAFVPGY